MHRWNKYIGTLRSSVGDDVERGTIVDRCKDLRHRREKPHRIDVHNGASMHTVAEIHADDDWLNVCCIVVDYR
jgi:hypothetical protein